MATVAIKSPWYALLLTLSIFSLLYHFAIELLETPGLKKTFMAVFSTSENE
jgi:hypothetical protein